jgi:hypothetical protein
MTLNTPAETNINDTEAALLAYDEAMRDIFTFNFAKLDDFVSKITAVVDVCADPLARIELETFMTSVVDSAFTDGKNSERKMIVIDQRFMDTMLDIRVALDGAN